MKYGVKEGRKFTECKDSHSNSGSRIDIIMEHSKITSERIDKLSIDNMNAINNVADKLEALSKQALNNLVRTNPKFKDKEMFKKQDVIEILNKPFLALKNRLNKFTSVAPVYRFLKEAENQEKSEKILDAIRARLSELDFGSAASDDEEEVEA